MSVYQRVDLGCKLAVVLWSYLCSITGPSAVLAQTSPDLEHGAAIVSAQWAADLALLSLPGGGPVIARDLRDHVSFERYAAIGDLQVWRGIPEAHGTHPFFIGRLNGRMLRLGGFESPQVFDAWAPIMNWADGYAAPKLPRVQLTAMELSALLEGSAEGTVFPSLCEQGCQFVFADSLEHALAASVRDTTVPLSSSGSLVRITAFHRLPADDVGTIWSRYVRIFVTAADGSLLAWRSHRDSHFYRRLVRPSAPGNH